MQRSSTTFKRSKHSVVSKDKYCKIWLSLYSMVFVRFAWCCGKMYCSLHLFSYRGSRKESAILRWKWSLPYVWKRSTPFETLYLLRLFYDLLCQSHPTTWCEISLTWLRSFAHWLVLVWTGHTAFVGQKMSKFDLKELLLLVMLSSFTVKAGCHVGWE